MSERLKFKQMILLVPPPEDTTLEDVARQYKEKAEACGYPNVLFGVIRDHEDTGVWIGSEDYVEGIKCSVTLFGKNMKADNVPVGYDAHENPFIDRFITENVKNYLSDNEIEYKYEKDGNFHGFRFEYLADQLTLLSLNKCVKPVLPPLTPSRPASTVPSFYTPYPCDNVN